MGNHPTSPRKTSRHIEDGYLRKRPKDDDLKTYRTLLRELPIEMSDQIIEKLLKYLKVITFPPKTIIVDSGQEAAGLYIVVESYCEVLAQGSSTIIAQVGPGEFFGEVGLLYYRPCSAVVRASSETTRVVLVKTKDFRAVLQDYEPNMSIDEWFIARKYLDTSGIFPLENDITHRMLIKALRSTPIFKNWSNEGVSAIAERMEVSIHPTGSLIRCQGDHDERGYILLRGAVYIGSKDKPCIQLGAGSEGIWVADSGIFIDECQTSSVTTTQTSLIAALNRYHLAEVLRSFKMEMTSFKRMSTMWLRWSLTRDIELYQKYPGRLELDIIRLVLRSLDIFTEDTVEQLYAVALATVVSEILPREICNIPVHSVVLVLVGRLEGSHVTGMENGSLVEAGKIFQQGDIATGNVPTLMATEESVIGVFMLSDLEGLKN